MKRLWVIAVGVALAGCEASPEEKAKQAESLQTSNQMTTYVSNLQMDVRRAEQAADKANKAIAKTQDTVRELQTQSE